ncbi:MAG TPA: PQQ-dependent sugar dehydrogenase [Vicinamibacterales bacterium]|jgi:glucose/arabinose dehydrogenase|nr:PQQ-dependent sugar dehydrogenase [Vicinamibacterales bacterium]
MNRRSSWAAAALVLLFAGALVAQGPGQAVAPPTLPADFNTQTGQRIRVTMVAGGLFHPWSIVFPDARTILVAEKNGKIRVIKDGVLQAQPLGEAPPHPASDNGLQFLALHPQFAQNKFVYLSYPKRRDKGTTLGISRGRFDGTTLADVKEIFVADAWETSGNLAGRLFFGPDGMLYATVGDRDRICCDANQRRPDGSDDNSLRMKAQSLESDAGKTLRLKDDGTIPPDNPFVGRAGAKPEIFTYGHRNGYGLAIHPQTGELWQTEIGPLGGDEVNVLVAGHNYGWPVVSMGRNYTGSLVSDKPWYREGMDNPRMFWVPSISPSSLLFYNGDRFKGWKGSMFIGGLTNRTLLRVSFNQPSQAERREPLLTSLGVRPRDIQLGPDGNLYIATEGASGGNASDGLVLKIEPIQ